MPRHSALTDAGIRLIDQAMEAGQGYYRAAATELGVTGETCRLWLRRGETGEEPYATLLGVVLRRRAQVARDCEQTMVGAARTGDTAAAKWLLTKLLPDEYGDVTRVQLELERGIAEVLDAVEPHMSREAYSELIHALARIQRLATGEVGEHEERAEH